MPAAQLRKELRAFCHEHHVSMRLDPRLSDSKDGGTRALTYSCTEPDCLVHYNTFRGYFVLAQKENTSEPDNLPNIRCLQDGAPMYLAEVDPEKKSFRLWICPHCDRRRTNEESLIGLASGEAPDPSGKSWVKP